MVRFCSCRPLFCDQNTAEHITPTVAARLLWQLSNIYHAGLRHIFAGRVDQVAPGVHVHLRVNGTADFHIQRLLAGTVQRQRTGCRRDINGTRIFTRHNRNKLTTIGVAGDSRINRSLNGGMGHALGARRADDEVRLRRYADGRRGPRRGVWIQGLEIACRSEVFASSAVNTGREAVPGAVCVEGC